ERGSSDIAPSLDRPGDIAAPTVDRTRPAARRVRSTGGCAPGPRRLPSGRHAIYPWEGSMFVPMSVNHFIDRAAGVYGERIGVVDEPNQPAAPLEDVSYARMHQLARAQAAHLDSLGIGVGERVAVVSHNSARLLTSFFGVSGYGRVLVPINFRLAPEEVKYIVEHSGARVLYIDPELTSIIDEVQAEHTFVLGEDEHLFGTDV